MTIETVKTIELWISPESASPYFWSTSKPHLSEHPSSSRWTAS